MAGLGDSDGDCARGFPVTTFQIGQLTSTLSHGRSQRQRFIVQSKTSTLNSGDASEAGSARAERRASVERHDAWARLQ